MIINGHTDIFTDINNRRLQGEGQVFRKYHYENFKRSKVRAAVFVIWTEPEFAGQGPQRTQQVIASFRQELKEAKDILNHARNYGDLDFSGDKVNMLVSFEGLEHLGEDLSKLKQYKEELGIFYASLTWNEKNQFATGAGHTSGGLTPLGRRAIIEMEKNNIVLDLSHLNESSFWQALDQSKKPVIASHSNSKTLSHLARNLSDQQLLAIREKKGLVGLNTYADFVGGQKDLDSFIGHIQYMKDLIGMEYLTFGFDFCDFLPENTLGQEDRRDLSTSVRGLANEGDIVNLISRMGQLGFTEDEIEAISYRNYRNFLKKHFI